MKGILQLAGLPVLVALGVLLWLSPRGQYAELQVLGSVALAVIGTLLLVLCPSRPWRIRREAQRKDGQLAPREQGLEYSLREVVARYVEPFRVIAAEKGVRLVVTFADGLPDRFVGTGAGLERVIARQLNEIVRVTQKGYIVVQVRNQKMPDGRSKFRFRVDPMSSFCPRKLAADPQSRRSVSSQSLSQAQRQSVMEIVGSVQAVF